MNSLDAYSPSLSTRFGSAVPRETRIALMTSERLRWLRQQSMGRKSLPGVTVKS